MGDKKNEASNQNKSLTIRVKARIVGEKPCTDKASRTNTTTLVLEIVDKIVRDEKTYYGYEVISDALTSEEKSCSSRDDILSAFLKNTFDDLKGRNLYLYSLEDTIEVADPCVSKVWQQMLISICKNHVFTFVLEFEDGKYNLKKVEC